MMLLADAVRRGRGRTSTPLANRVRPIIRHGDVERLLVLVLTALVISVRSAASPFASSPTLTSSGAASAARAAGTTLTVVRVLRRNLLPWAPSS
jgi:hypothetical protein